MASDVLKSILCIDCYMFNYVDHDHNLVKSFCVCGKRNVTTLAFLQSETAMIKFHKKFSLIKNLKERDRLLRKTKIKLRSLHHLEEYDDTEFDLNFF